VNPCNAGDDRVSDRDKARGLTPAVRDKVLRLAGRRMVLAGQRSLLAIP
jgi:hypothetical protein